MTMPKAYNITDNEFEDKRQHVYFCRYYVLLTGNDNSLLIYHAVLKKREFCDKIKKYY